MLHQVLPMNVKQNNVDLVLAKIYFLNEKYAQKFRGTFFNMSVDSSKK